VVGINDLMSPEQMAHSMKYDSVQGKFDGKVEVKDDSIVFGNQEPKVLSEKDPSKLPWGELGADYILESTGIFRTKEQIEKHIAAGAKKVLLSVPAKGEGVKMVVLGVNDHTLSGDDKLISNASCTTNCLAPVAKVLNDKFGLKEGLMTTIHSFTNDQVVCDQVHSDPRRSRAAGINAIPTTTGAAKAVGKVIPELNGLLNGIAVRVPTATGSLVDLVATLNKKVSVEEINNAIKEASLSANFKGILEYEEDPIVSSDIIHNPASSIFDAQSTMAIGESMVKVVSWYDNEWGYSCRCVDLFKLMSR
ncbi:MAG: type I glyceraldehyde-3-phosphate dehydrogenase, partial [Chitinivibrionales bacterium]